MFKVTLQINGENKTFERKNKPFLKNVVSALIVQQQQLNMYGKDDGPSDEDYIQNAKKIAHFASEFWNENFSEQEVLDGATTDALNDINEAMEATLGTEDDSKEDSSPDSKETTNSKKSQQVPSENP